MEDEKQKLVTRIQEAIVELKNKVELMLDLAYSCVMMNDREVAKEVEHLEEYIDWLHTQYELLILTLIERYGGKME
ncbi:MAG: PhoU domain-containing protein, partial [Candidatus Njordarchaeales archaeon]